MSRAAAEAARLIQHLFERVAAADDEARDLLAVRQVPASAAREQRGSNRAAGARGARLAASNSLRALWRSVSRHGTPLSSRHTKSGEARSTCAQEPPRRERGATRAVCAAGGTSAVRRTARYSDKASRRVVSGCAACSLPGLTCNGRRDASAPSAAPRGLGRRGSWRRMPRHGALKRTSVRSSSSSNCPSRSFRRDTAEALTRRSAPAASRGGAAGGTHGATARISAARLRACRMAWERGRL